jgi:hypothetical protein
MLIIKRGILTALIRDPIGLIEHMQCDHRLDRVESAVDAHRYNHVAAIGVWQSASNWRTRVDEADLPHPTHDRWCGN